MTKNIHLNRDIAQLILLQRIELLTPFLKRVRKILGRYFFTNFVSKYFISPKLIGTKYLETMLDEYNFLSKKLNFDNKTILSIGSGMCGLELIINLKSKNCFFSIIEKNYISKKVSYGWDNKNKEAYNNLKLLEFFLINNGMNKKYFEIYDFDFDQFPEKKFDFIISLYSLDYHYDFNLYLDYFKKILNKDTKLIFDTIRPDYFKTMFQNIEIVNSMQSTVHKSKRVICTNFIL